MPNLSISAVTREILGSQPEVLRKLESGEKRQREVARTIIEEVRRRTSLEQVDEASVAVAISRFMRDLKGGSQKASIEASYFQHYLQSASVRTIDNICRMYLTLKPRAKTDLVIEIVRETIRSPTVPLSVIYPGGIELYVSELDRERLVEKLRQLGGEVHQARGLALITIAMHRLAESAPGILSFLTGLLTDNQIAIVDTITKHSPEFLEFQVCVQEKDVGSVEEILRSARGAVH
ncbi:MAG: hypothetical protein ACXAB4_01040 [Candidatus Hodarchaeales archaeon]